jgi:murein DD-endopeptidase MepM/ murein hydrolase activator NlpD
MAGRRFVLLLALFLASCARTGPPAPYELHTHEGAPTLSEPIGPHPDQITVANGDTLYGLSRRYGVPTRAIIDANNLTPPYRLMTGTVLALPQVQTHLVQAGDTLGSVARRYGVDMSTLAATNHLTPPYVVRTGETLILPATVETASSPPQQTVASAAPVAVTAAPLMSPQPGSPPPGSPGAAPPPSTAPVVETDDRVPPLAAATPNGPPPLPPAPPPAPPSESSAQPVASPAPLVAAAPPPSAAPATPPAAQKLEQTASLPPMPAPTAGAGFLWPVRGTILSSYGTSADGSHNDGVNIAAPEGTPVVAAAAGEVAYAGNELKGYGNLVLIKHANGIITAYAHLESVSVKRFDKVARGQAIGRVGATGAVSQPQLHFEIRQGARAVDPAGFLPPESASAKG